MMEHHFSHVTAAVGDVTGGLLAIGAWSGHLPDIAAALSIAWFVYRFIIEAGAFVTWITKKFKG